MPRLNFFPTPIWPIKIDLDIKEDLQKFVEKTPSVSKSNIGGYQAPDFKNEKFFNAVQANVPTIKDKPFKIVSLYSWVNVNRKDDYNDRHTHNSTDTLLSGCYYSSVPPNGGKIKFYDPRGPLMLGNTFNNYFNIPEYIHITPINGLMLFFPPWLDHSVEPNQSYVERIAVSFNILKIKNVSRIN